MLSGQYTSRKDVMVRDLESSVMLVGRHAIKLIVLFLETIRKPLELKRPGTFPTSSQTNGATEAEWRLMEYPVLSSCTLACRETHTHTAFRMTAYEHEGDAVILKGSEASAEFTVMLGLCSP